MSVLELPITTILECDITFILYHYLILLICYYRGIHRFVKIRMFKYIKTPGFGMSWQYAEMLPKGYLLMKLV